MRSSSIRSTSSSALDRRLPRLALAGIYLFCFAAAVLFGVGGYDVRGILHSAVDLCPFHFVTGYLCPGCGMTRAFLSIPRLELANAWSFNPLSFVLFPAGIAWLARPIQVERWAGSWGMPAKSALLFAVLAFGLFRNLFN